jgi:Cys-rich repeat protein
LATGNHIAQWVERVERMGCMRDMDCPAGEFCDKGMCVPIIK